MYLIAVIVSDKSLADELRVLSNRGGATNVAGHDVRLLKRLIRLALLRLGSTAATPAPAAPTVPAAMSVLALYRSISENRCQRGWMKLPLGKEIGARRCACQYTKNAPPFSPQRKARAANMRAATVASIVAQLPTGTRGAGAGETPAAGVGHTRLESPAVGSASPTHSLEHSASRFRTKIPSTRAALSAHVAASCGEMIRLGADHRA